MSRARLTTKDFIEIARRQHGDMYDYSITKYLGSQVKVEIICRKHGSFWQWPSAHSRQGQGCPTCARLRRRPSKEPEYIRKMIRDGVDVDASTFAWGICQYAETKGVSIKSVLTRIIEAIKETHTNAS